MKFMKITLLSVVMAATSNAMADSGVVEIKGAITGTTCAIPADQMNRGFDIGTVEISALSAAAPGESLLARDLNFSVKNCPASTNKVEMLYHFDADSTMGNEYLRNNGTAQGVLLGLTDGSGNRIPKSTRIVATDLDASAGTASFSGKVQAYRIGADAPEAGTIDSTLSLYLYTY